MKKHIICLGDSNTHGYCADPKDTADGGIRFNENERWTRRLQALLGEEYLVVEEGLSGRTTCFDDPIHEGLSALDYITPCLKSHEFVDLLVIMLGTNDTKERFASNAACIAIGMGRLVKKALLQAGLDSTQFSAHKLRHMAATIMLSGGVDVKTVQEVLGHENLNTTQIYTHIENTELKIAAEANPLSKLDFAE